MTTAFVLSGGASLGAVQVGMLQALAEHGVRPDLYVGSSVGAVNAAWAADRGDADGLAELEQVWRGLSRADVFPSRPLTGLLGLAGRRDHLVPPSGLRRVMVDNLVHERLEECAVPLNIVVTDVLTGVDRCLSQGPAVEAVLASAAIPGVFPPVEIDGRAYVDGGVVNNTPISHALALGATTVWVLSTGTACALTEPPRSALGMAVLALTLTVNQRLAVDVERYAGTVDLHVVPHPCPIAVSPADFSHGAALVTQARASTGAWLATTG